MGDILVVDDDLPTVEFMTELFTEAGYSVRRATNATQALAEINYMRPALMLLDVHMPGVDGTAVCQEVRQQYPALPIVLITVAADEATELVKAGQADAFVAKPFVLDDLLAYVARFGPVAQKD
jgi:CheY-like chemotaxis protein